MALAENFLGPGRKGQEILSAWAEPAPKNQFINVPKIRSRNAPCLGLFH